MRRWLLWTIASVVVIAAGTAALFAFGDTVPFDFLRGHSPLALPVKAQKQPGPFGRRSTYYNLKGDFNKLEPRIIEELHRNGFKELMIRVRTSTTSAIPTTIASRPSQNFTYAKGRAGPTAPNEVVFVRVLKEQRFQVDPTFPVVYAVPEEGSIAVQITGEVDTDFLTRLRRAFGL